MRLDLAKPQNAAKWTSRLRTAMVAGQSALSVVLLVFAGLFIRSLRNVELIDLGYRGLHQIWFAANPQGLSLGVGSTANAVALSTLTRQMSGPPGVEAVALTSTTPFGSIARSHLYTASGDSIWGGPGMEQPSIQSVTPAFRVAAGIRRVAGRDFSEDDRAGTAPVAIVSALFAKRVWPGKPPLGQCVIVGDP